MFCLLVLCLACSKDDGPNDNPDQMSACQAVVNPYVIFQTPAYSGSFDSTWLNISIPPDNIYGDRLGWFNWDIPNNPGISNAIIFDYPNAGLEETVTYTASSVYGLTSYSGGNDATLIQCFGDNDCSDFSITFDEIDYTSGFACGSFDGQLMNIDSLFVPVQGSFKTRINP